MEAKFSVFQNIRKCFGSGIIGYDEKVPYHYNTLGTKKKKRFSSLQLPR